MAREFRELHDGLIGALGERAGGTMIDVLDQMATREDLALLATRRDVEDLEARIDARFDREGSRVTSEISAVRVEMAAQFGSVREDMASQFASVRHDLADVMVSRQTVVLTVIATIATLAAVIVGVVAVV